MPSTKPLSGCHIMQTGACGDRVASNQVDTGIAMAVLSEGGHRTSPKNGASTPPRGRAKRQSALASPAIILAARGMRRWPRGTKLDFDGPFDPGGSLPAGRMLAL